MLNGIGPDLRFAWRNLRKNPGFTAVAVLTLALGLGANTAIFSFVDAVLLKPLPFSEPERIVSIMEKPPGYPRNSISAMNFLDWKHQNTLLENLSAISWETVSLSGIGKPEQLKAQVVSACYFDVFGDRAAIGRTFAPDEDQPGKEHVAVISSRLWQSRFGAERDILGKKIILDGTPFTVIGVMRPGSIYDRGWPEIWMPLAFKPEQLTRDFHWLNAVGRMKPGVTLQKLRTEMDAIGARIARDYPESNKGWGVTVDPYVERAVGQDLRSSLYVLLSAVAAVLLIGCANLANLLLARGAARNREVAIRSALGAGRLRLIRQLLTESLLLSIFGAVAGLLLGYALMHAILAVVPEYMLPAQADVSMNLRVLAFLLIASVATTLLFGIGPALQVARRDTTDSLKESGGRSNTGGISHHRMRSALIVAEVALAFVLLTGAGLLIRSFDRLANVNPGFDSTNVITMGLPMAMEKNTDGAKLTSYVNEILSGVQGIPGMRDAAITSALPMDGWGFGMPFAIQGKPIPDRANRPACFFKMVTPAYFQALGMKLRSGRGLAAGDVKGSLPVTVVNETMAKRYFANENPIGKRILIQEIVPGKHELRPEIPWEVVGVVADEKVGGLDDVSPGIYVPYAQSPVVGISLVARGANDPQLLVKSIEARVWAVNKDQALPNIRTLESIKTESLASSRLRTGLLGVFACIAMLLAAIGIYGVISYATVQRMHEIGIRAALGATTRQLFGLIIGHGMTLAGTGLLIGVAGSFLLMRFISSLLFNTSPYDPITLALVAAALAGVALLASYIPARRGAKVDPMVALRYE